jgi:hypothetical protein
MLGITKKSSHKNTGLVSRAKGRSGNGKLSAELLGYLENKYKLLPWEMLGLRVVKSRGSLGNLKAYFIRVYDQELSARNGAYIKTYNDLDKIPELILYNGYILESGFVYITKYGTNVVSQNS